MAPRIFFFLFNIIFFVYFLFKHEIIDTYSRAFFMVVTFFIGRVYHQQCAPGDSNFHNFTANLILVLIFYEYLMLWQRAVCWWGLKGYDENIYKTHLTCSWHQKTKPRILQFTNSPILEFKVLQNVLKMKKRGIKCFFKVITRNDTPLKGGCKRLFAIYAAL